MGEVINFEQFKIHIFSIREFHSLIMLNQELNFHFAFLTG